MDQLTRDEALQLLNTTPVAHLGLISDGAPYVTPMSFVVDGEEILFREPVGDRSLVLFDAGDEITVQAGQQGIRFLLVSGKPIQEPVAWYGPIVMNTQAELQQAVSELRDGTFIKR